MAAGYSNLLIEAGATFSTVLEYTDSNNDPIDLTDYTGACVIRKSYYSNIGVHSLTVDVTSPLEGKLTVSATAQETASISPGRYVYDVEIRNSEDQVKRIIEGIAVVRPSSSSSYVWGATGATGI